MNNMTLEVNHLFVRFRTEKGVITPVNDVSLQVPEGKIVGYEVTAGNVGRNAEELLRKVQACQFVHAHGDQVCPANWKPGAETLKPSLDLVGQL